MQCKVVELHTGSNCFNGIKTGSRDGWDDPRNESDESRYRNSDNNIGKRKYKLKIAGKLRCN